MSVQETKTTNRFEISSLLENILLKQVRWCLTFVGLYIKKKFQHEWHHVGICAKNVGIFELYPKFVTIVYTFYYSILNLCQYFMDFFRIILQLCPLYCRYFILCLLKLHPLYRTKAVNRRTANSMAKKKLKKERNKQTSKHKNKKTPLRTEGDLRCSG